MRILLFFLLFMSTCLSTLGEEHLNTYFFNTPEEGIYKINNPFKGYQTVFVVNKNYSYSPYYDPDENVYYIYGEKNSTYQLRETSSNVPIKFGKTIEINNRTLLKYSLLSNSSTNWFHGSINEDENYYESLQLGRLINEAVNDSLTIFIYNYTSGATNFDVTLNGREQHLSILGKGEQKITLEFTNNDGTLNIKIYSPFNPLGLIKYEYKRSNRQINYSNTFQIITVDSAYKFKKPSRLDFAFFTLINGELKKIDFQMGHDVLKNILMQKASEIKLIMPRKINRIEFGEENYIVITSSNLMSQSQILVQIIQDRAPQNQIKLVNVQDIYDMYSYSECSASAIKLYLHTVKPMYVLLIGDANDKPGATNNIIPTLYFNQFEQNSRIPSDYKYTYTSNYTKPSFALGRLPISTNEELQIYIHKLEKYLRNSKRNKKLIVDEEKLINSAVIDSSYTVYKKGQNGFFYNLFYNEIIEEINRKNPVVLVHLGHGSFSGWRRQEKIGADKFHDLKHKRIFNLIDLSCWTGEFTNPNEDCFTEKLLKLSDKGAINVVSFSGFSGMKSYPYISHFIFNKMKDVDIGTVLKLLREDLSLDNRLSIDDAHALTLLGIPSLYFSEEKIKSNRRRRK